MTRPEDHDPIPTRTAEASGADEEVLPSTVAGLEADVESPTEQVVRHGGTFEAFRYRDYTLFWSGALVSNVGTWMQTYALAIVVYAFRSSEADLGIVNALSGLPVLFLAIPAGALADRVDRRKLLIWAQAALLVQAAALGYLYASGHLTASQPVVSLAIVSGLGLFAGVMSALTFPAWQSMVPDLVPRGTLLNAISLNAAQFQSARMLGPLAASGLVLLGATMGDIFYVNAASFLFVIAALAALKLEYAHPRPVAPAAKGPRTRDGAVKTLLAGFEYASSHRTVGILILSTAMMTLFGMPYMMLLPAVVDKALLGPVLVGAARDQAIKEWVSYVMAANGLGAVIGALIIASLPKGMRREPLVPYTLVAMAVLLVAFGLSHTIWLTLVISALTGAAFLTSTSLMNTSIQSCVPHHLRGRVMSLFVMAFMGIMPVSSLIFGPLAKAIGPTQAIIAGAAVLGAYALFLIARPGLLTTDDTCELDEAPADEGRPA